MKLRVLVKLKHDTEITCGACNCRGGKYRIIRNESSCGCCKITHNDATWSIAFITCQSHSPSTFYDPANKDCDPMIKLSGKREAHWHVIPIKERRTIKIAE